MGAENYQARLTAGGNSARICIAKPFSVVQDNLLHGRFLAELTQEVFNDLEASKYQHAEYRISIYGRKRVEWDILAAWVVQNQLVSDNVVWLIQVCCSDASSRGNSLNQASTFLWNTGTVAELSHYDT